MKHFYKYKLLLLSVFVSVCASAQVTTQFTNYVQGGINSSEFTTNNFKAIAVGKGNVIWAGSQYGGLYMYDDSLNIWRKSTKLTNVYINDIKPDADSGIWVAQSGTASVGGNSNIAGGVNYFPVASDLSMDFFSVQGTTTYAHLISRNAKALYIDQSKTAVNGDLPRPWVAQGTYITSFNTRRGGLGIGLNPYDPRFTNINDGFAIVAPATPIAESIGGNSQEVWVGTRQNGGTGSKILRYLPSGTFLSEYNNTNVPQLPAGFTAQAIFFDKFGNRWVGLKQGGLIIRKPDTSWVKMDAISYFQTSTQVNLNAMTADEYGNVFIGTTDGLLQYLSQDYNIGSSPDYIPSYKMYTTLSGLPDNNVTGLAYDKKNGNLLITTSGGISFMKIRQPYIKGVVFDVYTNLDSTSNPYPGLQKRALPGGVTVTLLKDGVEKEKATPDASGIFELKEANDVDDYSVEVKYVRDGRPMTYVYNNIRNHTLMEPTLFPDSLIRELQAFKSKMRRKCFPVQLSFQTEVNLDLFCTDGFDLTGYDLAIEAFYLPITTDHKKRVDNLANYYTSLATVYKLGDNSTSLAVDAVTSMFDFVDALRGYAEFSYGLKYPPIKDKLTAAAEDEKNASLALVKAVKDGLVILVTKTADLMTDEKEKQLFLRIVSSCNEVASVLIETIENGKGQGIAKVLLDNLKKVIAQGVAADYYRDEYAQTRHKNLVYEASHSAQLATSKDSYETVFDNLYNPGANSIAKYGQDTLEHRHKAVERLNEIAGYAEVASNALDAATGLAIIPVASQAALFAKALSYVAKGVKTFALGAAIYQGVVGNLEEARLSDPVTSKAGLARMANSTANQPAGRISQSVADSLVIARNAYNQSITELQAVYAAYDSATFRAKYTAYKMQDSLFSTELLKTTNTLGSSVDSASRKIPTFTNKLNTVVDSFVTKHYTVSQAMRLQNIGYILTPSKASFKASLDSLCNELRINADSAVKGMVALFDTISTNNIPSIAYLVQEGYKLNHSGAPGTTGTITYTFANRGSAPQADVSFKIDHPTGGYIINSADSVNVGTIQPGQSVQVTYTFTAPVQDSIGHYAIDVKAANGVFRDLTGTFYVINPLTIYSIKNGSWDDPATWSSNSVPTGVNPVYIYHQVIVNVDGSCKSATLSHPGLLKVNAGKQLHVLE